MTMKVPYAAVAAALVGAATVSTAQTSGSTGSSSSFPRSSTATGRETRPVSFGAPASAMLRA